MYSDNYRGGGYSSRGRRPYYGRGRSSGFGNYRSFGGYDGGGHDDRWDNQGGYYQPRPQYDRRYQGGQRGGSYYRGGGYRPPYRNQGWNHYDGGHVARQNHYDGGRRGQSYQPRRRPWGGRRPYQSRGYQPREEWRGNAPPPYTDPPSAQSHRNEEEYLNGLVRCCDLEAHSGPVTCIAFDEEVGRLFTAGADGLVRQWNGETGQVEHSASYNGEVSTLLLAKRHLFLAVHRTQDEAGNQMQDAGDIHIYNLEANSEQKFMAHRGRILAMLVAGEVLLSTGEDCTIKAWRYNEHTSLFDQAGAFGNESGRQQAPIECLETLGIYLFSGTRNGAIMVWNLETGQLAQYLERAHLHAVTSLQCWKGTLMSGGLDQTIKVWNLDLGHNSQQIVKTPPAYTLQTTSAMGEPTEVLSLLGTQDTSESSLLIAGLTANEVVLFDLPSFSVQSRILNVEGPRSLAAATAECVFLGLSSGRVRVYYWEGERADGTQMMS